MKKIFSLENFAYLAIVAMPLYVVRFSLVGVPTNLFEVLAVVTIILFLGGFLSSKIEAGGYKEYRIAIAMLLAGLLLSALFNDVGRSGWGIIKSWFIIPILFAWTCGQLLRDKRKLLGALYFSAFLVAGLALVYFFLGKLTFDGRLQAFYLSPNHLAMYLAPAFIIGFFLMKDKSKFYAGSLGVLSLALYLTQSYATWLAIAIATAIVIRSKDVQFTWKKTMSLLFVVSLFFSLQAGTAKLTNLIHPTERSSTSSRLMIWSSALKIGRDNPVWGIGPGNFQNKYLEYQQYFPPYLEWAVPQPHNLWLALWLQTGLLGLAGFLGLIVVWFKQIISATEKPLEIYIYLGIMLYILLHGLVDTPYFKNDLAVVFWLVIFAIKNPPSEHKISL